MLRSTGDLSKHTAKDDDVNWEQAVPVDEPEQTDRVKQGGLSDGRSVCRRLHFELKPSTSRHFHFGQQSQTAIRLILLDSPPIQHLANAKVLGVATGAATTDTWEWSFDPLVLERFETPRVEAAAAPSTNRGSGEEPR